MPCVVIEPLSELGFVTVILEVPLVFVIKLFALFIVSALSVSALLMRSRVPPAMVKEFVDAPREAFAPLIFKVPALISVEPA